MGNAASTKNLILSSIILFCLVALSAMVGACKYKAHSMPSLTDAAPVDAKAIDVVDAEVCRPPMLPDDAHRVSILNFAP